MNLFNDDSSNDELCDADVLNVRHEFDGPAGKKLLALQNRIGHDSRFRIDARFQEDEESGSDLDESVAETNKDDEQQRALNVLSSIVPGASLSRRKAVDMCRDVTIQRYDPTSADHQSFELTKQKKPKDKKTKDKRLPKETGSISTEQPDADKKMYFESSNNLKDTFVSTEAPFSLFGETPVIAEENTAIEPTVKKDVAVTKQDAKSVKPVASAVTQESKLSPFFIDGSDPKIQESLDFFCQHDKVKEIHKQWLEKRYDLIQLYRQRHRDAVKRLKTNTGSAVKNRKFKKK